MHIHSTDFQIKCKVHISIKCLLYFQFWVLIKKSSLFLILGKLVNLRQIPGISSINQFPEVQWPEEFFVARKRGEFLSAGTGWSEFQGGARPAMPGTVSPLIPGSPLPCVCEE